MISRQTIDEAVAYLSQSMRVKTKEPLAPFSNFAIGGPADILVEPSTVDHLQALSRCLQTFHLPYVLIGGGTNILISDEGFRGVVIVPRFTKITLDESSILCEASVGLQQCVQFAKKHGLKGLEHMVGIPGTIGGAIVGNAGPTGEWIDSSVSSVNAFSLETSSERNFSRSECQFSYRNSIFKKISDYLVVSATFSLKKDDERNIQERMRTFLLKRKKQPAGKPTAGCTFTNPPGDSAGRIIDQLGLKGKTIGGAKVSPDHANFIINIGGAKATDVITLISYIKQQVRDKRGIQLQEEIRYIGF